MQTHAILRHLARRHGLAGGSVREAALVDVLLEGTADLKGRIVPLVYRPNLQVGLAGCAGCVGAATAVSGEQLLPWWVVQYIRHRPPLEVP